MSEWPAEGAEELKSLSARFRAETGRRAALLDLIRGDSANEHCGVRQGDFIISPGQTIEMLRPTSIGALLTEPGERIVRIQVKDLMAPGKFGGPVAEYQPDRAFWRSYIEEIPETDDIKKAWRARLGIVFHYDALGANGDHLVTGEEEVGLMLTASRIRAYRGAAILVDGERYIGEDPVSLGVMARQVSEFTCNMNGLMSPPTPGFTTPPEFFGIDLSGFPAHFADSIGEE